MKLPVWLWIAFGVVVIGAAGAAGGSDESSDAASPRSGPARGEATVTLAGPSDSETTASPAETSSTTLDETTPVVTEGRSEVTPLPPDANPALLVVGVDSLPAGEPGTLSVIAQAGALERSGSLPVVVRNLTDKPVARIEVTGTIRDGSGALVGSGSDQGLNPFIVGPGEIAIGYVYFGVDALPSGSTVELSVTGTDPDRAFLGGVDLAVAEHNRTADSIVVLLRNDTDAEVSGPIGLIMMCFDESGSPTKTHMTFTEQNAAQPGATVSASFNFYGDPPCERYILGGSGFDF